MMHFKAHFENLLDKFWKVWWTHLIPVVLESMAKYWKIFREKFWLQNDLRKNSESSS